MAENKRFWSEDYSVGYYTEIVDNDKELANVPNPKKNLTIEEVVDLLNEQHETINELKTENRELNNEVKLLCGFFRNSDFTLDDFNKWLTEDKWKWEAKEVLEGRFGDLE